MGLSCLSTICPLDRGHYRNYSQTALTNFKNQTNPLLIKRRKYKAPAVTQWKEPGFRDEQAVK